MTELVQMNMIQALNNALDMYMAREATAIIMGEDVGGFGGVFRVTEGLVDKYGPMRVMDSPLAESVIGTFAERRGYLNNDQLNALNTFTGTPNGSLPARNPTGSVPPWTSRPLYVVASSASTSASAWAQVAKMRFILCRGTLLHSISTLKG